MNSIDSLPRDFLDRLSVIVPKENYQNVLNSFCERRPSTFRANTLRVSADKLFDELVKQGFEVERVSWCTDAFILKNKSQKELTETKLYKNGYLYIQGLSSMLPPLVLDPKHNEKILDITAAPGSKTTQIAALMDNTGLIVANDRSRVRLYILKSNLEVLGVTNVMVEQKLGQTIWKKYPSFFDKTLVDVPCSLEGRFQCDYPKSYNNWSLKKVKQLSQYQKMILWSAVSSTKPGGSIVYSTCTISPEENEEVVDWVLKKEKGNVRLENIKISLPNSQPGLTSWQGKDYDESLNKSLRLLLSPHMEAFYIALITRSQDSSTNT